jgi:diaminopimelate epimerase
MNVPFVKMSGAGNDMILVDHRAPFLNGSESAFARAACERREGIGADGLILVETDVSLDFSVRFFNPDGGEYDLCGNGARCLPLYVRELGLPGPEYRFRSRSGTHDAAMIDESTGRIRLPEVREIRLDVPVELDGRPVTMDWGDIGVPHAAYWTSDVPSVPIDVWGPQLRHHAAFGPGGTNVSFVERLGDDHLRLRTFERGVEGETLACGSGSTVVATLARRRGLVGNRVHLDVASGATLRVLLQDDGPPWLEGPVRRCFSGLFAWGDAPPQGVPAG